MKQEAQSRFSVDGQLTLDHYTHMPRHCEALSPVTTHNFLSDLRQFISRQPHQIYTERSLCTPTLKR